MTISEYIAEAMKSGKTVKIKYVKYSGEISERTISDIEPSDEFGEKYISAYCHLRNETRTFKISRIREVDGIKAYSTESTKGAYTPKRAYTPGASSAPSTVATSSTTTRKPAGISTSYTPKSSSSSSTTGSSYRPAPKKSEGCYIATMAYGDYDHPSVMVLRQFRDEKLLTNYFGSAFVSFYYWASPKMVKVLRGHRRINTVIRSVLDTIVLHLKNKQILK